MKPYPLYIDFQRSLKYDIEWRLTCIKITEKQPSTFTKELEATRDWGERQLYLFQLGCSKSQLPDSKDTTWHSVKTGEILYTDGIARNKKYRGNPDVAGIY